MLEEKPEYKKRKKYTKRRQQVIRQLFFIGVAVVVVDRKSTRLNSSH